MDQIYRNICPLTSLEHNKVKYVVYQFSRGPVSDFIHRYFRDHADGTWDDFKKKLTTKFSEISDPQHALLLLRKVKQKPDENVQLYAERLLTLAEDVYRDIPAGGEHVVNIQLVGFLA